VKHRMGELHGGKRHRMATKRGKGGAERMAIEDEGMAQLNTFIAKKKKKAAKKRKGGRYAAR